LAESVKKHHNAPFFLLLADESASASELKAEPFTVLGLDDVVLNDFHYILFNYTEFELCNALKAFLGKH
jgi:hypothetical protein